MPPGGLFPAAPIYDRLDAGILSASLSGGVDSQWKDPTGFLPTLTFGTSTKTDQPFPSLPSVDHDGATVPGFGSEVWFDRVHIIPTQLELGNILSTQQRTIEVFNAFRVDRDVNNVVNNAGGGITFPGLPSLPHTIGTFNSLVINVTISTDGPPVVDGNIAIVLDIGTQLSLVTGRRVVMFPARPEADLREELLFLTDIIESWDGTEQRIRVRDRPRQRLVFEVLEESLERQQLQALLFEWLPRIWGVPLWFEERQLQADAATNDTTIQVDTTNAHFRAGGLVLIYEDQLNFEAFEIDSLTASSLTLTSALASDHAAADTTIIPVELAYARTQPSAPVFPLGQTRLTMEFTSIQPPDLADLTGWTMHNGRVVLDDPNLMRGRQKSESWQRRVQVLDPRAGNVRQFEITDRSRLVSSKVFYASTPALLWDIRQLLHSLGGSHKSFYLPSFRGDLSVVSTIAGGSDTVNVSNVGFTDLVAQRQPFGQLRLVKTDGTAHVRDITSSVEISETVERITVDSFFEGSPIPVPDILRLELMPLVRVRDDRARLTHSRPGRAVVEAEVITVKE